MARVGLDIDGVLYPFTERFQGEVEEALGYDLEPAKSWAFFEDWGFDDAWFKEAHWDFVYNGGYFDGEVIGGNDTLNALRRLREAGHEVILVTARHTTDGQQDAVKAQTCAWLQERNVWYNELHFEKDKTKIPVDYFLDDKYENYNSFYRTPSDVKSHLLDQPWNQTQRHLVDEPLVVSSVSEYVDMILGQTVEDKAVTDGYSTEVEGVTSVEANSFGLPGSWTVTFGNSDLTPYIAQVDEYAKEVFGLTKSDPVQELIANEEEVRITDPKTGGQKGVKQAQIGAIDPLALYALAQVAGEGAKKYSTFNYLAGYDWEHSYNAAQRHLMKFWMGEELDPDDGLSHLAHAAWHCLAMESFRRRDLGTDTRYKQEVTNG